MSASPLLVTGNPGKLAEARRIFAGELRSLAIDLPEIQSLDLGEVVRAKGEEAWRRVGRPLIVEETGLELAALNGFPGPLVKWMLTAIGPEGLAKTALAWGDQRATARCLLLYRDGEREVIAEGVCTGKLVLPPRGEGGFGWDPVFEPNGSQKTFGELTGELKDRLGHRGRAWRQLLRRLDSEPGHEA